MEGDFNVQGAFAEMAGRIQALQAETLRLQQAAAVQGMLASPLALSRQPSSSSRGRSSRLRSRPSSRPRSIDCLPPPKNTGQRERAEQRDQSR